MDYLRPFFASLRHPLRFRALKTMKEKFLLILTDEAIILYKGLSKTVYLFKEKTAEVQAELKNFLSHFPKVPLYLLLDRNPQELREEELPPLWLWDQWRLIYHKKQRWVSQGEMYGYQFFKQDKRSYLQWVSISRNDPLSGWLSWIKSLPNPFVGVYFIPLEAGIFMQKHHASHEDYGLLIHTLASAKTHHLIFKGKRLLLSRPFSGEEDLKSSLHFLSRSFPDIHEKIQVFNLNPQVYLNLSQNIKVLDPDSFIHFLTVQKATTLSLKINTLAPSLWFKRGLHFAFLLSFFLTIFLIYQGIEYQTATQAEESKIAFLKTQLQLSPNYHAEPLVPAKAGIISASKENPKHPRESGNQDDTREVTEVELRKSIKKNIEKQRAAISHYHYLQSQEKDFFLVLTKLSAVLEKHHLSLESFIWDDKAFEIVFFLPNHKTIDLSEHIRNLLRSFSQAFPKSHLHILEGPFKSGAHETYKYPPEFPYPRARLRLELP